MKLQCIGLVGCIVLVEACDVYRKYIVVLVMITFAHNVCSLRRNMSLAQYVQKVF